VSLSPPRVSKDFFKAPISLRTQAPDTGAVDSTEPLSHDFPHLSRSDSGDSIPGYSVPLELPEHSESDSESDNVSNPRQKEEDLEYEELEDEDVDDIYEEALGPPPRRFEKKVFPSRRFHSQADIY
jgi:hypothetical protein